jgi:hypothetical protein
VAQASSLPGPEPTDSEDVALALETAQALASKGDVREALRWLRRATEAAERDGNDARTLAIARAAADLTSAMGPPTETPPSPPKPPGRSLPPPLPASSARPVSASVPPPRASAVPPLPPPTGKAVSSPQRVSVPPQSVSVPPQSVSVPPQSVPVPPQSVKPVPTVARASSLPPPTVARVSSLPARPEPKAQVAEPRPVSVPKTTPSKTTPDAASLLAKLASERPVVRVSVKRSARDPGLLVVRRLDAGKAPPAGASEALLVLVDVAADPFGDTH